jgi:transketolase
MRKTSLEAVYTLAKKDKRIVFIGSDLGAGVMDKFRKEMPERFFMEGVSEQHLIGMAAGMALEGHIVYLNTIATFITRRCYEQIVLELGLHNLKVRLIGSGGGVVYAPLGPTHLACDDIALMRSIPNMTVIAPADAVEMQKLMLQTADYPGPIYIRVAKGGDPVVTGENTPCQIGKAVEMIKPGEALIVTTGITLGMGLEAAKLLNIKKINAGVLHIPTLKPFDRKTFLKSAKNVKALITVEEHAVTGGLGSVIAETLMESELTNVRFKRIGFPDEFPKGYGTQAGMMGRYGITPENIVSNVMKLLS